ncbi:MAG: twin-arginine translocation signal domain-containing protein [Gemmatimonadota bacterium]|nr:twin-arginine translocation signal domain-containing protein [Gemmatimonadota bacterium]
MGAKPRGGAMSTDRRDFLRLTAATAGTLALGITPWALATSHVRRPALPHARRAGLLAVDHDP